VKISNETKVGLFAIFSLTILVLGYNFLKGKNVFNAPNTYYAYYENVDGLVESNPVLLYGYKVGKVDKIKIIHYKSKNLLVKFSVSKDVNLPEDTKAHVVSTDLLGAKAIELTLGTSKKTLKSNDTVIGITEPGVVESVSDMIAPIKQKVTDLLTTFDNVMTDIQTFLSKGGKKNLQMTLESLKNTITNLEHSTGSINNLLANESSRISSILKNFDDIAKNLDKNESNINNFLSNLSNLSDTLKAMQLGVLVREVNSTMKQVDDITKKINDGKGSLGLLVNNDSLYNNLTETSKSLNILINDLKDHPRRYINLSLIGGKDKSEPKKLK
jgi:phospholipid/cholesterol/gamma-HCH transport system substrate-binding protein